MNNVIKTSKGGVLNMRMVINDKKDTQGHTLIINHVNELQEENDNLKARIKILERELGKPLGVTGSDL